jgi:hypothetical protein
MSVAARDQNPTCNRSLKNKMMDHLDHALGRPADPLMKSYRNYFATDTGSALAQDFSASPFWKLATTQQGMAYFSVTDTGRQVLAEHLNKLDAPWRRYEVTFGEYSRCVAERSASKAKYFYWLDVSDCFSDMTFFEFCRTARARALPAATMRLLFDAQGEK